MSRPVIQKKAKTVVKYDVVSKRTACPPQYTFLSNSISVYCPIRLGCGSYLNNTILDGGFPDTTSTCILNGGNPTQTSDIILVGGSP